VLIGWKKLRLLVGVSIYFSSFIFWKFYIKMEEFKNMLVDIL